MARAIHRNGSRQTHPFLAVNCGALTETLLESELFGHVKGAFTGAHANRRGIFEEAGGGTVFLDEAGDTSTALQVKLLRVLQEREVVPVGSHTPIPVRARVIAASNGALDQLARSGAFRRDLLYRLNVITIHLPSLRERRDDIPLLAAHFIRRHMAADAALPSVTEETSRLLAAYSWPGNVRELENSIEHAITMSRGGMITADDLPPHIRRPEPAASAATAADPASLFQDLPTMDEVERRYVFHVLQATGGNRTRASEILGINRRTLYRFAARHHIDL